MLIITLVLHSDLREGTRGCMLKVGDEAPDFDLEAVTSRRVHRVKLSDFRGRNVVIAFHPLDWTPT
jgi:peroxiredoxin